MNFDSIMTWAVATSSLAMIGLIFSRRDGRSVMTRALLRWSIWILPFTGSPVSTIEETVGRILEASA